MEIKLGSTLRDPVTGVQGTAVSKHEVLGGNIQYGIQPKGKPDEATVPDALYLDHHLLEVVDEGISAKAPPTATTDTLNLGEAVTEIVTGFKGIVIERITHLNGCIRYYTVPKMTKAAYPDGISIDYIRLKKTGAGVAKTIKPKPPAKKASNKIPGGPNRRASEIRSAR